MLRVWDVAAGSVVREVGGLAAADPNKCGVMDMELSHDSSVLTIAVGQSVPDLHVHIIPRRPDATLKLNWQYKAGDMAEIKAVYEELKAAR